MRARLLLTLLLPLLLSGCGAFDALRSNASGWWQVLCGTVSGATLSPKEVIDEAVEGVQDLQRDVTERVENVSTGVRKIQEGSELIREGLSIGSGAAGGEE